MKLHHAAALALLGWFLMVPPRICNCPPGESFAPCACRPDLSAPLNKWNRASHYDSRDACEDQLESQSPPDTPSAVDDFQCVEEGDSRLQPD